MASLTEKCKLSQIGQLLQRDDVAVEELQQLLDAGLNINQNDAAGHTALSHAVIYGRLDCTRFLLERGANPNDMFRNYSTILEFAVLKGNVDCVQLLLQHGANVNSPIKRFRKWSSALIVAVGEGNIDCARKLLEHGADVNYNRKCTALKHAFHRRDLKMLQLLVEHGADYRRKEIPYFDVKHCMTALMAAALHGYTEFLQLLLKLGADVNETLSSHRNNSALNYAVMSGNMDCVKLLLKAGAAINNPPNTRKLTPLMCAAQAGQLDMVQMLLDHGAEVNQICNKRRSPLGYAAWKGHLDCMQLLLQHSAEVDHPGFGLSALQCAAQGGHLECMKLLLKLGADASRNKPCYYGPLRCAVCSGSLECVQLLVSHGADVNQRHYRGRASVLTCAVEKGHVACLQLLLQLGADVNVYMNEEYHLRMQGPGHLLRVTLKPGSNANNIKDQLITLARAVEQKHMEYCLYADVPGYSRKDKNSSKWVHCMRNDKVKFNDTVVQLLLERGTGLFESGYEYGCSQFLIRAFFVPSLSTVLTPPHHFNNIHWRRYTKPYMAAEKQFEADLPNLKQICRAVIRHKVLENNLQLNLYYCLALLPLPKMLIKYLLYSDWPNFYYTE